MKRPSLSVLTNIALLIAAVFVVWNGTRGPRPPRPPAPPEALGEDGPKHFAAGIVEGPPSAPIEVVELMDFQCPFCKRWSATLDSLEAEVPGSVRVSFHHWPLPNHEHAEAAAIAAECAHQQGAFTEMRKTLFAQQDSIGAKGWTTFAEEARVPDLVAFEACTRRPAEEFPRIQYGIGLAERQQASGTPTVWVNGEAKRPSLVELRQMLEGAGR